MQLARVKLPAPSLRDDARTGRVPAWLVGVAACGPPYRLGSRWLAEFLVVADPLPPLDVRPQLLPGPPGMILKLCWRSVAGLAYPSPFHLEIARRGTVLYDPWGIVATSLGSLPRPTA